MTQEFNGFSDSATLEAARRLLDQAREFPQAEPNLRGLDAFFAEQTAPSRVDGTGVYFAPARIAEFAAGIAGSLGRHLLKTAMAAKPSPVPFAHQSSPSPQTPIFSTTASGFSSRNHDLAPSIEKPEQALAPMAANTDAKPTPPRTDPLLASSFPIAENNDLFDGIEDFESAEFDEQDDYEIEPYAPLPTHASEPPKPKEPEFVAPPLSLAEIKSMMGKASAMVSATRDPVSISIEEAMSANSRFVFLSERWETKAGLVKKYARAACLRRSLRLEIDPPESLCAPSVCALFAIDPGDIPGPASEEALAQPDLEAAIESRLVQALGSAKLRGGLCGSWIAVVSGWGERSAMARKACSNLTLD